jgi:uncharacterized protein VirK/YbjX
LLLPENTIQKFVRRAGTISQYFFGDGSPAAKIDRHRKLAALLKPFKRDGFIGGNTFTIYLFSYLSRSFTTMDKLLAIYYHYSFLTQKITYKHLKPVYIGGFDCYNETNGEDTYSIRLGMNRLLELEGSLSLYIKVNGVKTSVLSFSFINGQIIGAGDEPLIYISCLQRIGRNAKFTEKAIAHFNDIIPAAILLKALEALAASLGIKCAAGVTASNQIALKNENDYERFYAVYDNFWQLNGGKLLINNYIILLPLYQKDISAIKQTHRNRVRRKRRKLQEVYDRCFDSFSQLADKER